MLIMKANMLKGTNYMKKNVEYCGQNCYIPTSGRCFIKRMSYFSKNDFREEFRHFIRSQLQFNNFVNFIISTSVVLMERE